MSSRRIALTTAELQYFGLFTDPFKHDPQSKQEVYFPLEYREVFEKVIDAIKYRHFVAVLGPVGSGKSTLQNYVREYVLTNESIQIVWPEFYNQTVLTPFEIARSILAGFNTKAPGRATALAAAVTNKLKALTENGNRVGLMFDNCHEMRESAVRSLKKFLEMSSGGFQRYLGIVLWGWPDFEDLLETPDFREIYERLDVVHMPDFPTIAPGYLAHRLKLVSKTVEDLFDQEAVDYICQNAETPLGLGNVANKALRVSMSEFDNKRVIGSAIKTKMFFENSRSEQGFRRR